jgi:hypothetical protein
VFRLGREVTASRRAAKAARSAVDMFEGVCVCGEENKQRVQRVFDGEARAANEQKVSLAELGGRGKI